MADVYNPTGGLVSTTPDKKKRGEAEAESAVQLENAPAAGSKQKKGKRPVPKAADFGGDMKAFGEALRKYREEENADTDTQARKRALGRMQ